MSHSPVSQLNGQVAGYATVYSVPGNTDSSSFTFATIKGAGHMVAQYEPAPALDMFTRFLNNAPF